MGEGRPGHEARRPTAEEMLERIRREAGAGARGRLRIYLGMAPGVGKTYRMLEEGRRRKERGTNVVIGFVETYGRPLTIAAIGDLEIVPRKTIDYKGVSLEEMDTEAIIARHPDIALIDELAHTNVPGSKHEKRWQDVEEILDHGITVISTLNVQHIESLADVVESITGTKVRERIPDHLVDKADELELVDMAPHALRQRISHGNVYPPERAGQALRQFFREGNLNALRELALRKVSTTVEEDLEAYMRRHEISTVWPAAERVMVAVDQHEAGKRLIRRGWRLAHRLQAEMTVVFIETPEWERATEDEKKSLEDNLRFATDLGAEVVRRPGTDVALELSKVAHEQNAGSVVMGRPSQRAFRGLLRGSIADRLIRLAPDIDVIIVAKQES